MHVVHVTLVLGTLYPGGVFHTTVETLGTWAIEQPCQRLQHAHVHQLALQNCSTLS